MGCNPDTREVLHRRNHKNREEAFEDGRGAGIAEKDGVELAAGIEGDVSDITLPKLEMLEPQSFPAESSLLDACFAKIDPYGRHPCKANSME